MLRIAVLACALLCAALAPTAEAAGLAKTKRILRHEMAKAGAYSGAHVVDLVTGRAIYSEDASVPRIPASVEKLYTTAAALEHFRPQGTIPTDVLGAAAVDPATGVLAGDLYLRGNGDPSFGAKAAGLLADILIERTGITEVDGRVIGDETVFDGLRGPPSEGFRTSSYVGPLSALTFNRGFTGKRRPLFQASPPLFAAKAFTAALRRRGVAVRRSARAGATPATAVALAGLNSPALQNLVASMNVPSDNFIAETLIKALGARFGSGGTTTAGAAVVRDTAARLGVRTDRRRRLRALALQPHLPEGGHGAADRDGRGRAGRAVRALAAGRRAHRHAARPPARLGGARRLPGQDRHAVQRLRAGGLLRDAPRRQDRLRVPHELRLSVDGPADPGPHDGRAGPLQRLDG